MSNADTIALGLSAFSPESVAFETTLASRGYAVWIRELKEPGYLVDLIYLWLQTPDLAVERVRERVRMGGHDIPEATVRRRYQRGMRNVINLYSSIVDTWTIYDNSVSGNPRMIARGTPETGVEVHDSTLWSCFESEALR